MVGLVRFVSVCGFFLAFNASADDCAAIREKLAKANPGETVEIPAGAYVCASPLVLDRDGVTLKGEMRGEERAVLLKLADHANAPVIVMGQATTPPAIVRNVTVRDLEIDGNMANQDIECWGGPCDSGGTAFIRNNGLSVRGVHDSKVENVRVYQARSGGLVTERGVRRLEVRKFEAFENYFDGLAGYETEDSLFADLYLHTNKYAGVSLDIRFNRNRIENALIKRNGDVGIFARYSEANVFRDVIIEANGSHGIFLAHDGVLANCPNNYLFENLSVMGSEGWGLWVNSEACTGTKIVNGWFNLNRDGCVFIPPGGTVGLEQVTCQ